MAVHSCLTIFWSRKGSGYSILLRMSLPLRTTKQSLETLRFLFERIFGSGEAAVIPVRSWRKRRVTECLTPAYASLPHEVIARQVECFSVPFIKCWGNLCVCVCRFNSDVIITTKLLFHWRFIEAKLIPEVNKYVILLIFFFVNIHAYFVKEIRLFTFLSFVNISNTADFTI